MEGWRAAQCLFAAVFGVQFLNFTYECSSRFMVLRLAAHKKTETRKLNSAGTNLRFAQWIFQTVHHGVSLAIVKDDHCQPDQLPAGVNRRVAGIGRGIKYLQAH